MDETDPRDIARAIREAYENRHLLRPSTESLRRVEEIYGWSKQKDALRGLYSSFDLLPSQPPAPVATPASVGERLRA
jgi:glycosyltransferase involved in cell wall biosynthesis